MQTSAVGLWLRSPYRTLEKSIRHPSGGQNTTWLSLLHIVDFSLTGQAEIGRGRRKTAHFDEFNGYAEWGPVIYLIFPRLCIGCICSLRDF